MAARAEVLGTPGQTIRITGSAGLPARIFTPSRSRSRATSTSASAARASTKSGRRSRAYSPVGPGSGATPPFDYAHDHFGYRDRLSQPLMKGSDEEPTPGSGAPLEPGEFFLGYPDEDSLPAAARSGGPVPQRQLSGIPTAEEHVGRSATSCANRRNTRGAGVACRETDGSLAQRRAAGPGAGS